MYFDLPLEQLVKRRGVAFQFAFATEAKELVPSTADFAVTASHKGLHVLARDEEGLVRPLLVLREVYGEALDLAPPRVRLLEGVQVKEPIMQLRISMYAEFRTAVKNALRKRGATLASSTWARHIACCATRRGWRICSASRRLRRLTAGSARHWIALSHYAMVTRDPGGSAA